MDELASIKGSGVHVPAVYLVRDGGVGDWAYDGVTLSMHSVGIFNRSMVEQDEMKTLIFQSR